MMLLYLTKKKDQKKLMERHTQKVKAKYMAKYTDSEDILIRQEKKIDTVTKSNFFGQTTHLKDTRKEEIYERLEQH